MLRRLTLGDPPSLNRDLRSAIWVLFSSVPCLSPSRLSRPEPQLALGLAEFVLGLASIVDRDLFFQL